MADYVSVDQFREGWNYFTKEMVIKNGDKNEYKWGSFTCGELGCEGCDDWIVAGNPNRNVLKILIFWSSALSTIQRRFKPKLIKKLGQGGQAKVYKAKFHKRDVAMKYIPLDKVKDRYEYTEFCYGLNEFYEQDKFKIQK